MIQFNVMFRTGDERKRREKSVGIGKSSHYVRNYTLGAESGVDDSEGKRVKRVCAFFDKLYGKNRFITEVDWSPKVHAFYISL